MITILRRQAVFVWYPPETTQRQGAQCRQFLLEVHKVPREESGSKLGKGKWLIRVCLIQHRQIELNPMGKLREMV